MSCDCAHERGGLCARFPKVGTVSMGRPAWAFPPADEECGEKSPRKPAKAKSGGRAAKGAKAAPDGAREAENDI